MNPIVDKARPPAETHGTADAEEKNTDHPNRLQTKERPPAGPTGILPDQGVNARPQSHSSPRYLAGNTGETNYPSLAGSLQREKERHAEAAASAREESNRPDEHGRTPLMKAAGNGDTKTISSLLKQGADLVRVDTEGNTALFYAARHGHDKAAHLLAQDNKALVSLRNKAGETAATVAAKNGKASVLMTLIYSGASLYELSEKKTLPIHAVQSGDKETVQRLVQEFKLRNQSSLFSDDKCPVWESMLLDACKFSIENKCDSQIIRLLIEGGRHHISFPQQQFLMELAEKRENKAVVDALLKLFPMLH